MKKALALILAVIMCVALFAACDPKESSSAPGSSTTTPAGSSTPAGSTTDPTVKPVTLKVVSMFGGTDAHTNIYKALNGAFENTTKNTISDNSAVATAEWRTQVINDFKANAEPDVLFYFNGPSAKDIVGKCVDIDTIRGVYPDYAKNLADYALKASLNYAEDGKIYCAPLKGFVEAIFCNKKLFTKAGLEIPKTWDDLMNCIKIFNEKGITPIDGAIGSQPHYWFDHLILSAAGVEGSKKAPKDVASLDAKWSEGLALIKTLYDAKAFKEDTASRADTECSVNFRAGTAAMYLDGSWFTGQIPTAAVEGKPDAPTQADITVIPIPSKAGNPDAVLAGFSSGWYITKKAWDDVDKRDAAVKYIMYQLSDSSISAYCGPGVAGIPASETAKLNPVLGPIFDQFVTLSKLPFCSPPEDGFTPAQNDIFIKKTINVAKGTLEAKALLEEMINVKA